MRKMVGRQAGPRQSSGRFRIVVASDGSPPARVAVEAAVDFPWPANSEAMAVVARGLSNLRWSPSVSAGIEAGLRGIATETERALRRRWPKASAVVVDASPADAILKQARGARVVVLGSHGYSQLDRWVLGSVSHAVVRRAATTVLVVKGRTRALREIVVGYDGSNHARRAIDMVASLVVPPRGRVTLLSFVEPIDPPPLGALAARSRSMLAREGKAFTLERVTKARRALERAARPLIAAGWRVRLDARPGVAARDLVTVPVSLGVDLLVIGAQGTGWKRLMLGSVVEAVLGRAPVSILTVR